MSVENQVTLIGHISKEIMVKSGTTAQQKQYTVGMFILAVSRGGNSDKADFIKCEAWNNIADNIRKYTAKGSLIAVSGEVQTSHFTDQETGREVYETVINVNSVKFLENKNTTAERRAKNQANANAESNQTSYGGQNNQAGSSQNTAPQTASNSSGSTFAPTGNSQESGNLLNPAEVPF